ncbi:hypothetical protein [Streptomyces griseorubiginosus]|uniref:hypothetical protein n=1 Tax=Streptomyces griseorubiginosus TaxID=67304 RepID=UPI001AD7C678|nr:hypothetical protein [Streptomyces griseorubiginosus]
MSATERSLPERAETLPRTVSGVSMRDLLASCAAATVISTPPRMPDPELDEHPEAA